MLQSHKLSEGNNQRRIYSEQINVSHESNNLSNLGDINIDTPSGNNSIIYNSNPNVIKKTNSIKESTTSSTIVQPYIKKTVKRKAPIETNKNNDQEDIEPQLEPQLEPIMEAPPLENIVKKDDMYEFYINDPERNTSELMFKNNTISTTKYNAFTFLPKALLYQFIRLANVYFVFIAIIQSIPIISPLGAATGVAPLVFVLAVSLIREAVEDLKRRKLDNEQNSNEVETYINGEWVKIESGNLRMGEIVKIRKDGVFPSDLMLIDSNLTDGICFIETGTLDGEKTLKIKSSPNFTKGKFSKINTNLNNNNVNNNNNQISRIEDKNFNFQNRNNEILSLKRQKSIDSKSSGRSTSRKVIKKKKAKKPTNVNINLNI